jgi:5-oxoprolinase (ATP-hydrolysing) subunit A
MLIDLNADLGEGAGTDADLMPLVTSVNVCCGFHAGDVDTVAAALELADQHGVRVGAHPGYADRVNCGRVELDYDEGEILRLGVYQLGALKALADMLGVEVAYLKPHGALYNQACRLESYATGVLAIAAECGDLPILGLPGSVLERLATDEKATFIPEGFADRRYRPDGSLVPRTEANALIHDPKEAVEQVEWLIGQQKVRTVCVHGDTPGAVEFVRAVRGFLLDRGHELKAFA